MASVPCGVRTYSSQLDVNALYSACQASAHAVPWVGTRKQRIDARPGLRENVSCDNIAPSTAPIIMAASTWQLSWQPVRRPILEAGCATVSRSLGWDAFSSCRRGEQHGVARRPLRPSRWLWAGSLGRTYACNTHVYSKIVVADVYGSVHPTYNPSFSAYFFQSEQYFSLTTNQPTVFFSRLISIAERDACLLCLSRQPCMLLSLFRM
jgi:hypothetical protein